VVGFRVVEGTPAFGKTLPFAGRRRNEGLGRFNEDEGNIQPSGRRIDDGINEGCSSCSDEEGNPAYTVLRQQVGLKGILYLGQLGPRSPALSSNGYRRKRWSGRGAARKRRHDGAVAFGIVIFGVLAAP
jgi:hypothetical protein